MAASVNVWMISIISLFLLNTSKFASVLVGDGSGVYVTFMDAKVANNGYIPFSQHESKWEVFCHTDKRNCCSITSVGGALGNWFYPNGSEVLTYTQFQNNAGARDHPIFATRRDKGFVHLYRTENSQYNPGLNGSELRGTFHCVVPDQQDNNQTIYINVLDIPGEVTITPGQSISGNVGESRLGLECSVNITTDPFPPDVHRPFFTWLFAAPNHTSLLELIPLQNFAVSTNNYSHTYTSTLKFPLLLVSHAGMYMCQLGRNEGLRASTNVTVNVPICTTLMSDPVSPITEKSNVTLTCTVEISPSVRELDLALSTLQWILNATLLKPNGNPLAPTGPVINQASRTFTYTVAIDSFRRKNHSGYYFCSVNLTSFNPPYYALNGNTSDTIRVTTGVYVRLQNKVYSNNSDILITDIGIDIDDSLFCFTDLISSECCNNRVEADWFYPNGSAVGISTAGEKFFKHRGNSRVRLHRKDNVTSPTGLFCCQLPDAANKIFRICVNIIKKYTATTSEDSDMPSSTSPSIICCTDSSATSSTTSSSHSDDTSSATSSSHTTSSATSSSHSDDSSSAIYSSPSTTSSTTSSSHSDDTSSTTSSSHTTSSATSSSHSDDTSSATFRSHTTSSSRTLYDFSENSSNDAVSGGTAGAFGFFVVVIIIILITFIYLRFGRGDAYKVLSPRPITYSEVHKHEGEVVKTMDSSNIPTKINMFPSDILVTEGEGVYFKIKVSGEPQPTVTWYHDGEPVKADYAHEIEADGSLAILSTELKHSGVYKAVATNQHGSEEREANLTVRKEEFENSFVPDELENTVSTRPIPILEFGKYVSELHADSNQPFIELYKCLDSGEKGHKISYATDPQRKALNRFKNIAVYDNNRIVLKPIPEAANCQGDYINACYIDGYSVPDKFIATQGPLPATLVDFWRLIWQEHASVIVMVTNVMEGTRIKCQQYWPESGKQHFGPFHVTITDQQILADYTIRTFLVSLDSSEHSRKVTQFHFTAWPDHGVPDYATSVLVFHRRMKAQHHPSEGPILVHCSAGVGRTGTFIAIDNILERLEKEKIVDVPGAITKMRQRRMKMVQTPEQFVFIHDAIFESIMCGDTQISAINLRLAVTKMKKNNEFQCQMKILEQVSPNPDEVQCSIAVTHPERNRGNKFLPADRWRVVLKGEQPDYIHAVNINGYKQKKAFIIAQGPINSTARNFWKMIYDYKSAVIVMLSDLVERGQEASAQYWPSSGSYQYGEYSVELLGEEPLQGFIIRDLSVMDIKTHKASHVTQLHITSWKPNGHCSNLKSVTDVIEEMTKVQIRSGNKPIVVHCSDTVTRSGMFCAIATTIERCKTEGEVDVFQVVKALRVQKPGAVPTLDNFELIFDAVLVFLESFDTYANFQNI